MKEFTEQQLTDIKKCIGMTICRLRHKIRWHERTGGGKSEYKDNILAARKSRVERLEQLIEYLEQ